LGWNIDVSGDIARLGDSDNSEGPVSLIRMMSTGNGAVIGVRDGEGNLVLKNWQINPDGSLKRKGDTALQNQPAGAISLLAVAPSRTGLVSAVRDSSGHLKLINWEIVANGGIKRLGDSGQSAGAINTTLDMDSHDDGLVTAVRTADPRLKLIKWKISDGGTIMRIGDSGDVDLVSAVALESEDDPFGDGRRILTAVRTREKTLLLILWHVTDTGDIQRIGDSGQHAGGVDLVRIFRAPVPGFVFVTAVRDSQGHLKLITWTVA
jgi:hypothetical protein